MLDSPALRYPRRTTPALRFFGGGVNSLVDCGAIHNAAGKLWVSFWTMTTGATSNYFFGKWIDDTTVLLCQKQSNGTFRFVSRLAGANKFDMTTGDYRNGAPHHVICSISSAAGARLIVDGGTPATNADVTAAPNGGNFVIGDRRDGAGAGIDGLIFDLAIGTDDLTTAEERGLFKGIIPADATEFYRMNEGHGLTAIDLGTGGNDGTLDATLRWETRLRTYVRYS